MSIPQIRTEAIEAVGRKILMEYDPSLLSGQPCPVPIETIIETKFDLILEFHTLLSHHRRGSLHKRSAIGGSILLIQDS